VPELAEIASRSTLIPVPTTPIPVLVCPKLGFADDPASHFSRPTAVHRCYANGPPEAVSTLEQREFCLSDRYGTCPRLRAAIADAATARTLVASTSTNGMPRRPSRLRQPQLRPRRRLTLVDFCPRFRLSWPSPRWQRSSSCLSDQGSNPRRPRRHPSSLPRSRSRRSPRLHRPSWWSNRLWFPPSHSRLPHRWPSQPNRLRRCVPRRPPSLPLRRPRFRRRSPGRSSMSAPAGPSSVPSCSTPSSENRNLVGSTMSVRGLVCRRVHSGGSSRAAVRRGRSAAVASAR